MSALAFPTAPLTVPSQRRHLVAVPDLPTPALATNDVATAVPAADASVPMRLTARGRAVLVGLALMLSAAVGVGAGLLFPAEEPMSEQVQTVTVGPGENLWMIASEVAAEGQDVRIVIDQIMALNNLSASTVHAGAELTVPAAD